MRSGYLKRVAGCTSIILGLSFIGSAQADSTSSLLAQAYQQWSQGHLDKAQQLYESAVKADPSSVEAHMKLAGLLLSRNDFNASIKEYQRLIGLDSKNAKAWIGLGIAYLHGGDKSMTRAAWEEALRLDPSRKDQLAPLIAQLDSKNP
jgi:Tfp pilus assembly protein PilF